MSLWAIKMKMLWGVQTGNGTPNDKYYIRSIAHARTNRKDDIFMQNFTLTLEWGKGLVHWQSTHCAEHIPRFFPLHAAYSALRHFLSFLCIIYSVCVQCSRSFNAKSKHILFFPVNSSMRKFWIFGTPYPYSVFPPPHTLHLHFHPLFWK